jgi:hypothetical protein
MPVKYQNGIDVEERRAEVESLVAAGAMIYVPKRDLGAFREKAGMSSWVALSERAGVHQWHFSYTEEDAMTGNFTLPIWLRVSLALGRHPFAIAQVAGPVGAFDMSPYQKIYRRPGAEVWGWEPEEIDAAVESEQAKIVLDRNNLADVREAAGLPTWRSLSQASGLSYHTLQKLNYPGNNPSVASVMRIALACRVHPYSLLQVSFPPM